MDDDQLDMDERYAHPSKAEILRIKEYEEVEFLCSLQNS